MRFLHLFFFAFTCIVACGQNEPLANYEPKSSQEIALKSVLLAFESGVRSRNSQQIGDLLHETAAMMVGRDRQILNKAAYIDILPERLRDNPPVAMGKPKIKIAGNLAEVKIYMKRGNNNTLVVFNMINENDKWYIKSWKY